MKNSNYKLAAVTAVLLLGSTALSADGDQPWHITYQAGGADLDSSRNTSDTDIWQGVGFGYFLTPNFSLDLEYDQVESDYSDYNVVVPGASYDEWNLRTLGLVGRYYFGSDAWRPFVLGGVGSSRHSNILDTGSNVAWSLGFGVQGQISKHFSVRGQAMWRRDSDDKSLPPGGSNSFPSSYDDYIYSVGLSFDFGGKAPPPPPPPPPPAAPPPPPPNPDLDGDGVLNEKDKCPNTRPGAVVDLDGCEVEAVISLEGVHFDFDKATLRPEAMVILNNAAGLLNTHERVVVEVAGHTDSVGTEVYNQGLSERRANAVRDYLVSKGVKASRLTARGYGEVQPVASNDTAEGRQANRRVELIVLDR